MTALSSGSAQQMAQLRLLALCKLSITGYRSAVWIPATCFQITFIPVIADTSEVDLNCKVKFIICCHLGMLAVESFHAQPVGISLFLAPHLLCLGCHISGCCHKCAWTNRNGSSWEVCRIFSHEAPCCKAAFGLEDAGLVQRASSELPAAGF